MLLVRAGALGRLLSAVFPLLSAFLYGENLLGQPQRTQTRNREEICRAAGRVESKEGLCWSRAAASRCQSDAGGKSLSGFGPAAGIYSAIQDFAANFSRAGVQRIDSWRY